MLRPHVWVKQNSGGHKVNAECHQIKARVGSWSQSSRLEEKMVKKIQEVPWCIKDEE